VRPLAVQPPSLLLIMPGKQAGKGQKKRPLDVNGDPTIPERGVYSSAFKAELLEMVYSGKYANDAAALAQFNKDKGTNIKASSLSTWKGQREKIMKHWQLKLQLIRWSVAAAAAGGRGPSRAAGC
jgi:hypothetical protein